MNEREGWMCAKYVRWDGNGPHPHPDFFHFKWGGGLNLNFKGGV